MGHTFARKNNPFKDVNITLVGNNDFAMPGDIVLLTYTDESLNSAINWTDEPFIINANRTIAEAGQALINQAIQQSNAANENLEHVLNKIVPVVASIERQTQQAAERHTNDMLLLADLVEKLTQQTLILNRLSHSQQQIASSIDNHVSPAVANILSKFDKMQSILAGIQKSVHNTEDTEDLLGQVNEQLRHMTIAIHQVSTTLERKDKHNEQANQEPMHSHGSPPAGHPNAGPGRADPDRPH